MLKGSEGRRVCEGLSAEYGYERSVPPLQALRNLKELLAHLNLLVQASMKHRATIYNYIYILFISFWILTKSIFTKISKIVQHSVQLPLPCVSLAFRIFSVALRFDLYGSQSHHQRYRHPLVPKHLEDACKCRGFPANAPRSSMEWSRWGVQYYIKQYLGEKKTFQARFLFASSR